MQVQCEAEDATKAILHRIAVSMYDRTTPKAAVAQFDGMRLCLFFLPKARTLSLMGSKELASIDDDGATNAMFDRFVAEIARESFLITLRITPPGTTPRGQPSSKLRARPEFGRLDLELTCSSR